MSEVEPTSSDAGIDRDALRRAYELTAEPVASLQQRFGLSPYRFQKLRIEGGWTPRPQIARPGPLQGHKPIGAEALDFRLSRLVAIGTGMLERKVADEGMTEANARTLKELCRAQETRMRSTRNEKAAKAREKKNIDDGHDFRDDPNWLKAEFGRRLDLIFGPEESVPSGVRSDDAGAAAKGARDMAARVQHGAA
jgi:hypothetical protein